MNVRPGPPLGGGKLRDILVASVASFVDAQFLDPANSGSSGLYPASATATGVEVTSTGASAQQIVADLASMLSAIGTNLTAPVSS